MLQFNEVKNQEEILYSEWKLHDPKAALLLVHGLGAHSGRWDFLAEFFLKYNFSSYGIELKGFGKTKGLKGHVDSLDTYLRDILTLRNIITQENPNKKIFIIGESMGALLAFLIAGGEKRFFDGIICISPAFKSRLRFSVIECIKILLSFICCPKKQLSIKFTSAMCTRDKEYQKVMDSESREHRLATLGLLLNLARAQLKAKKLKDKIKVPLLFLLAGEDKLVDPRPVKRLFDSLKLEDKTIFIYPEMYHALSIDIGREKVFRDILKWAEERV